jgi:hypothetical protein
LPEQELAVSVLTNANDGFAHFWLEGAIHILRAFAQNGAPLRNVSGWTGRCWTLWGAIDLVPMGKKVLVASSAYFNPFMDASELEIRGCDAGRIALAGGYAATARPFASSETTVTIFRKSGSAVRSFFLRPTFEGDKITLPEAPSTATRVTRFN